MTHTIRDSREVPARPWRRVRPAGALALACALSAGLAATAVPSAVSAAGTAKPRTPAAPAPAVAKKQTSPIGHYYLMFDVSLLCDSRYVAAAGGLMPAIYEMMSTLAEVDRIFARTDFGWGDAVRLRPLLVNCYLDFYDPFLDAGDSGTMLDLTRQARATLAPESQGALTHVMTPRLFETFAPIDEISGLAYLGRLGTPLGASWSSSYPDNPAFSAQGMAHEIGHNFGAYHDGDAGFPCAGQGGEWIMSPAATGTEFSPCSRDSINAYLGTLGPPTYHDDVVAPPFADAGGDIWAVGMTSVVLDGSGSSDPQGQPMIYSWSADGACEVAFASPQNAASVQVSFTSNPQAARDCRFLLTVTNGAGYTSYDAVRVHQVPGVAPAAPTDLAASAVSSSIIRLTWSAVPGAARYTVHRWDPSAGAYVPLHDVTGTFDTDRGLAAGTTYFYALTATSSGGTSGFSNIAGATTPAQARSRR